ncbi:MAG: GNAT family N-acetyltransferase [Maribacter sp.]
MIKKLDHRSIAVSEKIRSIFQASYAVEAKLLQAKDFPPLKRDIDGFLHSDTAFYGYYKNQEMVAAIEIKDNKDATHIQSLVVAPEYFKQGIAQSLISYLFDTLDSTVYTVETGAANQPAKRLYIKNGFIEIGHYNAEFDIKKVRFEKIITTIP